MDTKSQEWVDKHKKPTKTFAGWRWVRRNSWAVRRFFDVVGLCFFAILWGTVAYSIVVNIKQFGIDGLVLGRYLGRVEGGNHTLATLAVIAPMTYFVYKAHMNWGFGFAVTYLADYFHEAIWNLPYYIYYHMTAYAIEWFGSFLVLLTIFYGTGIWRKREYSLKPLLWLVPWFILVTIYLYATGGGAYSTNVLNPVLSQPNNLWVNAYEIGEVAFFAMSLCYALMQGLKEGKVAFMLHTFRERYTPARP
jgi:hypothetical protein